MDLLGIHPNQQKEAASLDLIHAVVKMRSTKTQEEIEELERAAVIGYKMHTTAMAITRPGLTEKFVGGQIDGTANSYGATTSFATIYSQHGEIMHGNPSMAELQDGRLVLCDCGGETLEHYCSDNTRTFPINGKFTQRQLEIYSVVEKAHDYALELAKPGVKYMDVHFGVCKIIFDGMKELGLAKGDTEEAVRQGAHAMFLPHGLGHMMGMDVHDMEALDQIYVGFDEETRPNLEQFGTNCLRMGRRLQEGFVVTDEPGIYFIPALIDDWRASGLPLLRQARRVQGLRRHPTGGRHSHHGRRLPIPGQGHHPHPPEGRRGVYGPGLRIKHSAPRGRLAKKRPPRGLYNKIRNRIIIN